MASMEAQRGRLERYMPTLSTIITAAPMLGILGTVTGIIQSFRLLAPETTTTDPRLVSQGIAEALLTTAAGLIVALVVLFPYNAFRAQIDKTLGRFDALIAAAHGNAENSKLETRNSK
jgi:biopolymer transport protein ExbB